MKKWLVKFDVTYDEETGESTKSNHAVKSETNGGVLPGNNYLFVKSDESVTHPLLRRNGSGEWEIVQDDSREKLDKLDKDLDKDLKLASKGLSRSKESLNIVMDVMELHFYIDDAAFLADKGLIAERKTQTFNKGDQLDTESKVRTYALEVLRLFYANRKQRLDKYKQDRADLGV
jgi:hypothetical protein